MAVGAVGSNDGKKKINEVFNSQISILKALSSTAPTPTTSNSHLEIVPLQIEEIAEKAGLRDEREAQRFLYILEGQKLVSPHPAGDFTSRHWHITKDGLKALRNISTTTLE